MSITNILSYLRWVQPFGVALVMASNMVWAMGPRHRAPAQPTNETTGSPPAVDYGLKKAIDLPPIADRFVENLVENPGRYYFGKNIFSKVINDLQNSKKIIILVDQHRKQFAATPLDASVFNQSASNEVAADPCLVESSYRSSARIQAKVSELIFATGTKFDRMTSGFFRGEEDQPIAEMINEFYLRTEPLSPAYPNSSWFGPSFNDYDQTLHVGKELAHEMNFDFLLASASIKQSSFYASMALDVNIENHRGQVSSKVLRVQKDGYYYDVGASLNYLGGEVSLAIMAARRATLTRAFEEISAQLVAQISTEVAALPLITKLKSLCGEQYLLGVGVNFNVKPQQRFYDQSQLERGQAPTVFVVDKVYRQSAGLVIESLTPGFHIDDELVSLKAGEAAPQPSPNSLASSSSASALELIQQNLLSSVYEATKSLLETFYQNTILRAANALSAWVTLPYRIWRFQQYDQKFDQDQLAPRSLSVATAQNIAKQNNAWAHQAVASAAGWQTLNSLGNAKVKIAIVDSGVDYNHRALRGSLFWDSLNKISGWDFISGDDRPYDDHSHGTELASIITGLNDQMVGVAPLLTIMPIKVFSGWGLTSSQSLYRGIDYALKANVDIILVGWATRKKTEVLENIANLVKNSNALLVTSAGEGGYNLTRFPHFPANYSESNDHVISVAGYDQNYLQTSVENYVSNWGAKVDLAAPGANLLVADPRNNYNMRTHTGLAAAWVAGAAGLLKSACPNLSAVDLKKILIAGSKPLARLGYMVAENQALNLEKASQLAKQNCIASDSHLK